MERLDPDYILGRFREADDFLSNLYLFATELSPKVVDTTPKRIGDVQLKIFTSRERLSEAIDTMKAILYDMENQGE